jgi:hypothetical protein
MTLHRRNPRRDANEPAIVEYLQRAGCVVCRISSKGVPDLLVGYRGTWLLLEVKMPKGRKEPAQELFHNACDALKLPCHVVYSADDAKRILRRYA